MDEKKTESVSVKLTEHLSQYVTKMADLHGTSAGGFIRSLIAQDMEKTLHDLNVRAAALGAKVIHENLDFLQK